MMRKPFLTVLLVTLSAIAVWGQSAPTLRVQTEDPSLPSELFYGNTKVKPLRLRPGTNQPITINDADFFVQQHYLDFLSRFPDQSGFNYWQGEITGCGTDAGCIDAKRVNTSAAFFLSIEFENTGYFVYRLTKASFKRLPLYAEFIPQSRQVGAGVVVLQEGWEAKLEANKQAFVNAWVNRSDFQALFPNSLTNAAYVDALIESAGVPPGSVNRDALVAGLNANTETRATVLRKIVESSAFDQKERNSAFVYIQYAGYLRRDPDTSGFEFWLRKLNDHNGDFKAAEMVRSFILSLEYIARF